MYYRDYQDFNRLKREYRANFITDEIDRTRRHIVEVNENLQSYIAACHQQLVAINNTEFKRHVYFNRRQSWTTKRIEYHVGLIVYPDVDGGVSLGWPTNAKTFTGREKKAARLYADELADQNMCQVEGG